MIPVSIAVLLASYKVQDRVQTKTMTVKMTCADGIQEYIETIRDLNQGCDIVFDHVGFAYNSGETVLKDVSFTAKQGEVTALVGPSGGGKTTVSRLAARFWDHQQGEHHGRRNGHFQGRPRKAHGAVFHRVPGCDAL